MPSFLVHKAAYVKSFDGARGEFDVYRLELKDADGMFTTCETLQKPATPAPIEGSTVEGTIETGQYGARFKKTHKPPPSGRVEDPKKSAEIRRMHCQKAALHHVQNQIALGKLKEDWKPKDFQELVDFFEEDVVQGRERK